MPRTSKAVLIVENSGPFECQFNPKELKLEDTALWKASDENGKPVPLITYERGEAATLSMELIFDSTDGGSVQPHIDSLRAMLTASVPAGAAGGPAMRPPWVTFVWGGFTFAGACEKISASVLMFRSSGQAIRAKVMVTLKEKAPEGTASGNSGGGGGANSVVGSLFSGGRSPARALSVPAGATLSQVSAQTGVPMRDIADANNIDDPMNFDNTNVVIPATPQLAKAIGASMRGGPPGNISAAVNADPFGGGGFDGQLGNLGDNPEVSAAFSSSGLDQLVDQGAEKAHETVDKLEDKASEQGKKLLDKVGLGDKLGDKLDDQLGDLAGQGHEEIDGAAEDLKQIIEDNTP